LILILLNLCHKSAWTGLQSEGCWFTSQTNQYRVPRWLRWAMKIQWY